MSLENLVFKKCIMFKICKLWFLRKVDVVVLCVGVVGKYIKKEEKLEFYEV